MITACLQTVALRAGRKNRARASFGGNWHCSIDATKALLVTQPEKDHVDPGETADMPSKGGGLCVPSWGLAHIWNIPKFHSHKTNNSELIISLIRH